MVFLCAVVLFVFFVNTFFGWVVGVKSIYLFDAVVDVFNELHFAFELVVLLGLRVKVVYFLMQVFYFFEEVDWMIGLIHQRDINIWVS